MQLYKTVTYATTPHSEILISGMPGIRIIIHDIIVRTTGAAELDLYEGATNDDDHKIIDLAPSAAGVERFHFAKGHLCTENTNVAAYVNTGTCLVKIHYSYLGV